MAKTYTQTFNDWIGPLQTMPTLLEAFAAGRKLQKQDDLAACAEIADLYGEDSERGLAAEEIKRRIRKNG